MAIKLFDSLRREIVLFEPISAGKVTLYNCGPTVWNYVHIGNWRAFTFVDLLRRSLEFLGFEVTHATNITDVDDKTIRGARESGRKLLEFTEFYTAEFFKDFDTLGLKRPHFVPRATQEIEGMVKMIEDLLAKGHAYRTDKGDIYFKISSFPEYGRLANIDLQQTQANADGRMQRADEYDKENAQDFALWKAWDELDGDVAWETALGKGRPGWHLECSVMSSKYLGQPLDIHCGGIDLIFPHHTNEIAQSECACGKPLANYWMHNAHLMVNGRKMSKSLNNFFTLRDLLAKGLDPQAIRYELLKTHYRQPLDFREEHFDQPLQAVRKYHEFWERLQRAGSGAGWSECTTVLARAKAGFVAALEDDLNVAQALTSLSEWMNEVYRHLELLSPRDVEALKADYLKWDSVLGFLRPQVADSLPAGAAELIAAREAARKTRDFARADELRKQLLAMGIAVKDEAQGTRWQRIVN